MSQIVDRRSFLKSTAAMAGVAAMGSTGKALAAQQAGPQVFSSVLLIGNDAYWGKWVKGGNVKADVPSQVIGGINVLTNGRLHFDEIQFDLPLHRMQAPWAWIQEAVAWPNASGAPSRDIRLAWLGNHNNSRSTVMHQIRLHRAVLSEIRFPGQPGAGPYQPWISLKIQSLVPMEFDVAGMPSVKPAPANSPQDRITQFRLQIKDLEPETVQAFNVKVPARVSRVTTAVNVGNLRDATLEVGSYEFERLQFFLPLKPSASSPLRQWAQQTLIQGRNQPSDRRPAVISYLNSAGSELARLGLVGLLPSAFAVVPTGEGSLQMNFEMSFNQMILT